MTENEKIQIFTKIQDIETFHGCVKVFEKGSMKKEIVESNIFFNYAVKLLFNDCIIPLLNLNQLNDNIEFIVSVDNRNIRVGDLNNLETYLKTEFCLQNFDFKITYYDSSSNFGIQMADLTVNTFYNLYKDKNIVTLETVQNTLILRSSSAEIGRVEEKMDIQKSNEEEIKISFSARYMMDALKSFSSSTVELHFVGDVKPIILKSTNDDTLTQLVLPIRTY